MRKLILIIFAFILIATNPNKANYIEYAKQSILGHNPSGLVSFFVDPLIERTTTENNLLFGTIYRTHYGNNNAVTLGILNRFIPLK